MCHYLSQRHQEEGTGIEGSAGESDYLGMSHTLRSRMISNCPSPVARPPWTSYPAASALWRPPLLDATDHPTLHSPSLLPLEPLGLGLSTHHPDTLASCTPQPSPQWCVQPASAQVGKEKASYLPVTH